MIKQIRSAVAKFKTQLPYLPRAFELVYHAAAGLSVFWIVLLLIQGLLPVASVYLTKILVNGIAVMINTGGGLKALIPILPAALAMMTVLVSIEVLQGISRWLRTAQSEKIRDAVHKRIHDQAMRLDMSYYDDPNYYDRLHHARVDALSRPAALIENAGTLLQSFITLLAMASVLMSFGILMPVLLIVSTFPALAVVLHHTIRFHDWRLKNTMAVRQTNYYDMILTSRDAASELRLFGLGSHFRNLFSVLRHRLRNEQVALARSEARAMALAALVGIFGMALALIWLIFSASRGKLDLGDLALFMQAFFQGQRMMRSLLSSAGEIYRNVMFLENLFEFLDLEPRIYIPDTPHKHPGLTHSLEMKHISFTYPGSRQPTLKDFNFSLKAGEITALVGENGVGKTTIIKLLCRFYDPESGCVMMDGIDIRNLEMTELRRRIAVLFQEPVRYHDTVAHNIAFGDIDQPITQAHIKAAAVAAGADGPISRLPEEYATILGKWFGGAELSGGEWQRLALARAFLRKAELIILDEPTSSMDSWAEADWLSRFRTLAMGRTALIITHRFTTAMQADTICVMDQSGIIESGTHEELLAFGGRYSESWTRQMREIPFPAPKTFPTGIGKKLCCKYMGVE